MSICTSVPGTRSISVYRHTRRGEFHGGGLHRRGRRGGLRVTETAEQGEATAVGPSVLDRYTGDLVALVRRYPVTSVLIGLGVGVLLARSLGVGPARARPPSTGLIHHAGAVHANRLVSLRF